MNYERPKDPTDIIVQMIDRDSWRSTPEAIVITTPAYASPARSVTTLPKIALDPSLDPKRHPIPGQFNPSSTTSASIPQPVPSALVSARIIEDIGKICYPEGIKAPSSELNLNASSGKFRYDRDFLMQFMKLCKEKPDDMSSLDALGLKPSEQQGGFAGRRGRPSMPATASIPRAISGAVQFPRQPHGHTNSTSGPPIQGISGRGDALQHPQSGCGSKSNDSKVEQPSSGMYNLISATLDPKRHPIPGQFNLSSTTTASIPQFVPSALASARIIEDIGRVSYPAGIKAPSSKLNLNASSGKFRYDRDFLMQFMKLCKEKPDDMPSLEAIGIEASEEQAHFAGRRGRRRRTNNTSGPPIQGAPAQHEVLQRPQSSHGSKRNGSKVG